MSSMAVVNPFRLRTRKCNAPSRIAFAAFLFHKNLLCYRTATSPQLEKECALTVEQHWDLDENYFSLQSFLDQTPLPK